MSIAVAGVRLPRGSPGTRGFRAPFVAVFATG